MSIEITMIRVGQEEAIIFHWPAVPRIGESVDLTPDDRLKVVDVVWGPVKKNGTELSVTLHCARYDHEDEYEAGYKAGDEEGHARGLEEGLSRWE